MKRGRPASGGYSRNANYYNKKIKTSDSRGCSKITAFISNINQSTININVHPEIEELKIDNAAENQSTININDNVHPEIEVLNVDNAAENLPSTFTIDTTAHSELSIVPQSHGVLKKTIGEIEEKQASTILSTENEKSAQKQSVNIHKFEKLYDWMYYNVTAKGFLCKYCSITASTGVWIDQAANLGDHPTRCITKHATSAKHMQAVSALKTSSKNPICDSLIKGAKNAEDKLKDKNLKALIKYVKILYFMIKKDWAVSENFSSLVKFIGEDLEDKDVGEYIKTCAKNATYLSSISVDNFTEAISRYLEEKTITALQVCEGFSLLADESTDEAQREQLGLMVKYKLRGQPAVEEYLGMINLSKKDAMTITSVIEKFMIAKGITISNCLFLSLDGANVMSGEISGVQRRMRHLSPHSLYINCRNHRLALVFTHLLKKFNLLQAVDALLVGLWKLFHYSPTKHQVFKDIQGDVYGLTTLKMLKVSTTRWLSHGLACERVIERFKPLVEALDFLFTTTKEPELKGIREQLLDSNNLLCILFLSDFLKIINKLSLWLQSRNITFNCILEKLESTTKEVKEFVNNLKSGENFRKYDDLLKFAEEHTMLSMKRRSQKKIETSESDSILEEFMNDFVKDFLQDFEKEIYSAFKVDNKILGAFQTFNVLQTDVRINSNEEETCLCTLISFYGNEQLDEFQGAVKMSSPVIDGAAALKEIPGFEKEMSLTKITYDMEKGDKAKSLIRQDNKEEAKKVLEQTITPAEALEITERDPNNWILYPNLMKLFSLSTIIPSSTASVERLFSQMNLVCTDLRARLKQETLDKHLRIILNGPEKLTDAECKAIINIFKSTGNRRILL